MNTFDQISPSNTVARVKVVANDGHRLYLEFRNGLTATVDSDNIFEFNVGSVVLLRSDDELQNHIELAPDELWPEESWVGVVRLKLSDSTIVDSGGRWKIIETRNDIPYKEGNTIEAKDSCGIIRVLSEKPLQYVDLPAIDDNVINKFKTQKTR